MAKISVFQTFSEKQQTLTISCYDIFHGGDPNLKTNNTGTISASKKRFLYYLYHIVKEYISHFPRLAMMAADLSPLGDFSTP